MPQINTTATPHTAPAPAGGWKWLPFSDPGYLGHVRQAVDLITTRISTQPDCDAAFRRLPRGRGFPDLWSDPKIWVSYDPALVAGRFGATLGKDIAISQFACRMGAWTIVATLIHELAHVNGASRWSDAAERMLNHCSLQDHFNPNIIGQVTRAPRDETIAALHHGLTGRSG